MGWLSRMTQFKDKAGKDKENVSVGLFSYPTLMAADILIYKATHVPVGEDQKQHLELCRNIAQKFNNDFKKNLFPIIDPVIMQQAARVMSLRDGSKKMSKSDASEFSRIMMSDDPKTIEMKIKKAKTDSKPVPDNLKDANSRPEANNLISIYAAINNIDNKKVISEFGNKDFSFFKKQLAESLVNVLQPISSEINKLLSDTNYLDRVISSGSDKASKIAKPVINEVHECIGLLKT